jgi:integrase
LYLIQKGRIWYLEHRLSPKQAKAVGKSKLSRSLGTDSKREAQRLRIPVELEWRRMIAEAMDDSSDGYTRQLKEWRRVIREADTPDQREIAEGLLQDELEDQLRQAAKLKGIDEDDDASIHDLPEYGRTFEVFQRATGRKVELTEYMEDYFARLEVSAKTANQHRAAIRRLAEQTPFVSDVVGATVQEYFDSRSSAGTAKATLQRELSGLRGYWRWLSSRLDTIDSDRDPFARVDLPRPSNKRDTGRRAYTSADAVGLLRGAVAKPDAKLADLIRLGMFTGARLEELCVMTVDDAQLEPGILTIRDSKTLAGIREVPIHPRLRPVVERLKRESTEGYLIPALRRDKYDKRSAAIGKRFGRLKTSLGFTNRHVFHSFRHTLNTLLTNAGVHDPIVKDILGHEHTDMTRGVYYDPTVADQEQARRQIQADAMAKARYTGLAKDDMR